MNTNLIIGYGVVGSNLYKELSKLNFEIEDKYKNIKKKSNKHYIGFVCVDTPLMNDSLDITEVENAINENECDIYVIKSTCPVGTIDILKEKIDKRIIFSPEFYGETQHCNNYNFDYTILGGDKLDCIEVLQELQKCYDARHQFRITDSKTAEMLKLMENSYLATKVSFCTSFYESCKKVGIHYEELRELFCLDPRVNPSHTFVYSSQPYWNSHCLNKDVPAVASLFNNKFLKDMIHFNETQHNNYNI